MSKDTFKSFARLHPELANTVLNGKASWQQLYELFEIYGESNSIWNNYIPSSSSITSATSTATSSVRDVVNAFKNLDMDSVQKGITNIQKTIGLLQDIGLGSKTQTPKTYEPRPLYKHFED